MSFLSRLGLKSVFSVEANHGAKENEQIQSSISVTESEDDTEDDVKPPVVLDGAIFQSDLITVFPGYEVHFLTNKSNKYSNKIRLYQYDKHGDAEIAAELFCDFFIGFNSVEARKTIDNLYILLAGTHLLTPDPEDEDIAEFTLK